jgi:hypothetical protein
MQRYEEAEQLTRQCEEACRANDVHSQILWRSIRAKIFARRQAFENAKRLARQAVAFAGSSAQCPTQIRAFLGRRGRAIRRSTSQFFGIIRVGRQHSVPPASRDDPAVSTEFGTPREFVRKSVIGDPAKVARAIIDSVDVSRAPKRLTLGSNTYKALTAAWRDRLAALEASATWPSARTPTTSSPAAP